MARDRAVYKMFKALKNRQEEVVGNDQISDFLQDGENCCIVQFVKLSYKSYKLSEHTITFIIGFLAMSFGWAAVSGIYLLRYPIDRVYYALSVTVVVILVYWLRSALLNKYEISELYNYKYIEFVFIFRTLQKWKRRTKLKNGLSSTKNEKEYDLLGSTMKYHRRVYTIAHRNYFFRKAFGIMVAMPWELAIDKAIEEDIDHSIEIMLRFVIAICATIMFSYWGFKFIEIEQEAEPHSITRASSKHLQQNYVKLKRMKTIVVGLKQYSKKELPETTHSLT